MTHVRYLKISGDASQQVEQFIHEIRKQQDDAQRYGVNISVTRVELDEADDAEFSNTH